MLKNTNEYVKENFENYITEFYFHLLDKFPDKGEFSIIYSDYTYAEFSNFLLNHLKVLNLSIKLENFNFLYEEVIYSYNVFISRGIDEKVFLNIFNAIISISKNTLYLSISKEIEKYYNILIESHNELIELAKKRNLTNSQFSVDETLIAMILNGEYEQSIKYIDEMNLDFEAFVNFLDDVLAPILNKVGLMWENNLISFRKEHLATALIQNMVEHEFKKYKNEESKDSTVIISTSKDENHRFIIEVLKNIFIHKGYNCILFNSDTEDKNLIDFIKKYQPSFVIFSSILKYDLLNLKKQIDDIKIYKENIQIVVGGSASLKTKDSNFLNVDKFCNKLSDLKEIF